MSFSWAFARATLERAVRTGVQALLALWLANSAFNILTVDWGEAAAVAGSAAALSVLTSLAAGATNPSTGPSFNTEVPTSR